jgi:hypothetical protein
MTSFLNNRALDGFAITPNDSADLTRDAGGIYVGVTGNVVLDTSKGTTLTFVAVPAGTILPIDTRRVRATGTTATSLIALTL